jgi:hypothetical protein
MIEGEGVGSRLKAIRRWWGAVTNREMELRVAAEMIETTAGTWSKWENDLQAIRPKNLKRIVAVSHSMGLKWVTPAWLMYGVGEGPPVVSVKRVEIRAGKSGRKLSVQQARPKGKAS